MVSTAVGKLCVGNVQNPLPCPLRDQVDKAQQILTGIPEAHSATQTALKITGTATHIEGDHALVLVPDVHHPVQLLVGGIDGVGAQQAVPVIFQFRKSCIHLCICLVFGKQGIGGSLVDDIGSDEFLISGILAVAQNKDIRCGFAGFQLYIQMVRTHRLPAMGNRIAALARCHCLRIVETVI